MSYRPVLTILCISHHHPQSYGSNYDKTERFVLNIINIALFLRES